MAAEHAELGSDADAAAAVETSKSVAEESIESAIAGAVFEQEHIKTTPEVPEKKDEKK